jgi:hypothetical protein
LPDAAAVFCTGQADLFPQRPQQWRVWIDINVLSLSINGESSHLHSPFKVAVQMATIDVA